jgi:hypothetical protein
MARFDPIATPATSSAEHLASFKRFPPKQVMGLRAADPRA